MRPRGTGKELENRRLQAVKMLENGVGVRETARRIGVCPGSVSRWKKMLERKGVEGIRAQAPTGARAKMTKDQKRRLLELLKISPRSYGYACDRWTLRLAVDLIKRYFGVTYHPSQVCRILHSFRQGVLGRELHTT